LISTTTPGEINPELSGVNAYGINMVNATLVDPGKISNRNVCIIDTGYDIDHQDLQDLNVSGNDGNGSNLLWSKDGNGHGTHVAGTIAALGNNDLGVVGVIPNGLMNLHIVRVFDEDGKWAWGSTLANSMYACADAKSNIISMSLGTPLDSLTLKNTCDDIYYNKGILLVAAAGNEENSQYSYPASYDSVMSVAAVNANAQHASFSQYNDQVNIAAPGVAILSTTPGNQYESFSGTSSKLIFHQCI
jgi:serine protease